MAQQTILDFETSKQDERMSDALTVCKGCGHLVPKTMLCLYCGEPILFKKPRKVEPGSVLYSRV